MPLPDGRRKYVRGKTKAELDAKVEKLMRQMGMGADAGDERAKEKIPLTAEETGLLLQKEGPGGSCLSKQKIPETSRFPGLFWCLVGDSNPGHPA